MSSVSARSSAWILSFFLLSLLVFGGCATGEATLADDASADPVPDSGRPSPVPPEDGGPGDTGKQDARTEEDAAPPPAPAPSLTAVAPQKATAGSPDMTVTLTGAGFVARSTLQVDGAPVATSFVSATELKATLPAARLARAGTLALTVSTATPGGGTSAPVQFVVENPLPTATSLSPMSATTGSPDTALTVTGTAFVNGAKVVFDGVDLVTTFASATSLQATIPAPRLLTPGTYNVTVVSPAPGGGTSAPLSFTVSTPTVQLTLVTPAVANVGAPATSIQLTGSGFIAQTQVLFNGAALASTYVSASRINATIPASSLTAAGDFAIVLRNPPPGGGVSAPFSFRVQYLAPVLGSVTPGQAQAGSAPVQVVLGGSAFYPASQVTFDGVAAATTYVSSTELRATLSATQLASAGAIAVRVATPPPGGGTSALVSFSVQNPGPTLTSLSPSQVGAGAPDTTLTLTGTGFVSASVVKSNGANLATTYVSATTLRAVVPAAQLATAGSLAITVTNPAPGGGTSAPRPLAVGCDSAGVDVQLGPIGNITTLATNFAAATPRARIRSAGVCPTTLDAANLQPARFWVVQNTAGVPVILSSWAVCPTPDKQEDAFLTFYRRATVPATDAERAACSGVVSEGASGLGGYGSPDTNNSTWCPGLLKSNAGGMALGVCEKAVVHIQPWSNTSTVYVAPPQVRFRADAP